MNQWFLKKANQYIYFKLGDFQLLDIENFLGGTKILDSFLKAYKTSETDGFFLYDWFNHTDKVENTDLSPYDALCSKLRGCNPLEVEYTENVNLVKSEMTAEQAVAKLKLSKTPPKRVQNYQFLQKI